MAEKVGIIMKTTATMLRTMVMDNALTLGRLNKDNFKDECKGDYAELTTLYRNALDALTIWAGKDYAHTSDKSDMDNAFTHIKAILELYATNEDRIVIDHISMRTMRDLSTKPKRLYSKEYTVAEKARKAAYKTAEERATDLITLGCPEREEEETVESYAARIREAGIKTVSGTVDMLEMYINANAILTVKTKAVDDIKAKGNWTWKRPVATDLSTFAELVENYIADCLMDGYNLKSSKTVREERAVERQAKADAKKGSN